MPARNLIVTSIRKVWAGPFAIGPLIQPISLGAALLRVLEVIWKFAVAGAVVVATVFGVIMASDAAKNGDHTSFESQLFTEAGFDPEGCGKETPLAITVRNGSTRTLRAANVEIIVTHPGRSTNLNSSLFSEWDLIVPTGKIGTLCYSYPSGITDDPKSLEYSATLWSATSQD